MLFLDDHCHMSISRLMVHYRPTICFIPNIHFAIKGYYFGTTNEEENNSQRRTEVAVWSGGREEGLGMPKTKNNNFCTLFCTLL